MVGYVRFFCFIDENFFVLILSGNGVEIVRGGDAWLLGSVRILEHRGGHWSSSMKSFSAKSSRTLNPLSCDCGRHIDVSMNVSKIRTYFS